MTKARNIENWVVNVRLFEDAISRFGCFVGIVKIHRNRQVLLNRQAAITEESRILAIGDAR